MPKLSIITTIWEPDPGLIEAVKSTSQCPDSEHLISVAGDLEKTRALLEQAGLASPILIAASGAGISEGFNACLRKARGEFIWVLNSGDRAHDLAPLLRRIDSDPELDFAYGNVFYGNRLVRARAIQNRRSCLWHGMGFCHGAVIVRASFHQKFGNYDPAFRICMDAALFIAATLRGAKSAHVDAVIAHITPGGVSSNINARVGELRRVMRRHVCEPIPTMLAAKWLVASHLTNWFSASHDN